MPRKRYTRDIYRDTKTGRFAKKSSWDSDTSGKLKRERYAIPGRKKPAGIGGGSEVSSRGEISGGRDIGEDYLEDYFYDGFEAEEEDEY